MNWSDLWYELKHNVRWLDVIAASITGAFFTVVLWMLYTGLAWAADIARGVS